MQRGEVITILKEDVDLMSQISKLGPEHKDVIRRIVHINNLQRYVVQEVISASSSTLNLVLQVLLASVAKQNLLIRILGLTNQERELIRKYAFLPLKEKKFLFNFMQYCLMGERLGAVNRKSEKRDKESDDNNWDMVNIRTLFTDFISRASTCGGFVTQDTKEDVRKKSNSRVANSDRYVSILKPDVNAKRKNIADSKTDQDDVTDDDDDYDDLTCPEAMLSSSSNSSPNILCESVETERSNAQKKPKRSSSVSSREENSKEKNTLLSSANDIYSAKTKETNEEISLDTTQEINLPSKDRETKSILRGFRGFSSEPSSSMAWLERRMRRRTDKIVCSKTKTAVSSQRNNNAERFEGESAIKNTTCNSSPKVATFETESQRKGKRNFDMSESSSTESKRPASGEKRQQDVSGKSSQQKKNIEKKVDVSKEKKCELVKTGEVYRRGKNMSLIAASMSQVLHNEEVNKASPALLRKARYFCREAKAIYALFEKYLKAIKTPKSVKDSKSKYTKLSSCVSRVLQNILTFQYELGCQGVKDVKEVIRATTVLMDVISGAIAIITDQVDTEPNDGEISLNYCNVLLPDVSSLLQGRMTVNLNDLESDGIVLKERLEQQSGMKKRKRSPTQAKKQNVAKRRKSDTSKMFENTETPHCSTSDQKNLLDIQPPLFVEEGCTFDSNEASENSLNAENPLEIKKEVPEVLEADGSIITEPLFPSEQMIHIKEEVIEIEDEISTTVDTVNTHKKHDFICANPEDWQNTISIKEEFTTEENYGHSNGKGEANVHQLQGQPEESVSYVENQAVENTPSAFGDNIQQESNIDSTSSNVQKETAEQATTPQVSSVMRLKVKPEFNISNFVTNSRVVQDHTAPSLPDIQVMTGEVQKDSSIQNNEPKTESVVNLGTLVSDGQPGTSEEESMLSTENADILAVRIEEMQTVDQRPPPPKASVSSLMWRQYVCKIDHPYTATCQKPGPSRSTLYACDICSKAVGGYSSIEKHIRSHFHAYSIVKCKLCSAVIENFDSWVKHKNFCNKRSYTRKHTKIVKNPQT